MWFCSCGRKERGREKGDEKGDEKGERRDESEKYEKFINIAKLILSLSLIVGRVIVFVSERGREGEDERERDKYKSGR